MPISTLVRTFGAEALLIFLSFLAGAIHVLAPDHWVPISVLAWQKSWKLEKTAAGSFLLYLLHVLAGIVIYLGLKQFFPEFISFFAVHLIPFTLILIVTMTWFRSFRFNRVREVLRGGPESRGIIPTVLSILGPSESLIPILIKAKSLGYGYLSSSLSYLAGTLLAGIAIVLVGRLVWNKPFWLPIGLYWSRQLRTVVPLAACLTLGLTLLLKLG